MFSSKTGRGLLALTLIIGLLTVSVGAASAAPPFSPPAGIEEDQPDYYEPRVIPAWEHTVVIVHVTDGADPDDLVDMALVIGDANDYVNGRAQWLVDVVITVDDGLMSYQAPFGFLGDKPWAGLPSLSKPSTAGSIAHGLNAADAVCHYQWATICDVVLVTYEAPASARHQRQAMAEAMKLNASYANQLHTIAVDKDIEPDDHRRFSSLLGALGNYAWGTADEVARDLIHYVITDSFWVPVYEFGGGPDEDWPDEPLCEVYDPDGNCYYGEDDGPTETSEPEPPVEGDYDLYLDLLAYSLRRSCDYPGIEELDAELDKFSHWLVDEMIGYLKINYPELEVEADQVNGLALSKIATSGGLAGICDGFEEQPTPDDPPPVEPAREDGVV